MAPYINYTKTLLLLIAFTVLSCSSFGQGKTELHLKDYPQWGTLSPIGLSPLGNWASYSMEYHSGKDTLFLSNTSTLVKMVFPKGRQATFIDEQYFAYLDSLNILRLVSLKGKPHLSYGKVTAYSVAGKHLIFTTTGRELKILPVGSQDGITIPCTDSYALSPDKKLLACCTSSSSLNTVALLNLKEARPTLITQSNSSRFIDLFWQQDGQGLGFMSRAADGDGLASMAVYHYSVRGNKLSMASPTNTCWPSGRVIASFAGSLTGISDDGSTLFFALIQTPGEHEAMNPQVWNTHDKVPYAFRHAHGDFSSWAQVYLWRPGKQEIKTVGSHERPSALLLEGQRYALVFDPSANRPSLKYEADRDYYLKDLVSGTEQELIKGYAGNIIASPEGKYIAYFKADDWWVYSTATALHTNITAGMGVEFYETGDNGPWDRHPYGFAGWCKNDGAVLVYDRAGIWKIGTDGSRPKRLAAASANDNLSWRIYDFGKAAGNGFLGKTRSYDLAGPIILQASAPDNSRSGYAMLRAGKMEDIILEDKKISGLLASKNGSYMAVRESFNYPPALVFIKDAKSRVIFQSNPQHFKYPWGKSELVEYSDSKGKKLKGVLFYPFGYRPEQTYPMVVHIYERLTHHLHQYTNPTMFNATGFDKTNFTGAGYFVFYPDIAYRDAEPGISALDCVTAATKAVLDAYPIDPKRIGLIGHSFGGYEVNYIIARSSMFAAAVSGNGISDLKSFYLSLGWSYGLPNTWRFEYDQFRIPKPPFSDWAPYNRNSPVVFLQDVEIPLLLWVGGKDTQVNPFQSMEMYIGLGRLGKESTMLVYPDEGHVLTENKNQEDLTRRIMEWFGFHLNGEPQPDWLHAE